MSGGYLTNAGVFLLNTLFGLFIGAALVRLLLQWARADFYNPLSQAIVKLTNPALRPLRRYIPALGPIDTASMVLMLSLQLVNTWLVTALLGGSLGLVGSVVIVLAELVSKLIYIYLFAIVIQAIASWIAPGNYNPMLALITTITEPLLRPIRRVVPPLGGLDLSSLVVIIALQMALMLIVAPLADLATLR
ncbi:MAG: YggT family protein [Gammaproteobacteria bacterium]|nr:YggT family protein [Gammaproteobacteria bacterium]